MIRFQMRFLPALQKLSHCLPANDVVDDVIAPPLRQPLCAVFYLSLCSHESDAETRSAMCLATASDVKIVLSLNQ
jgi:hypothetical protein